jgi:glycosyltransferase involved in cell wall biosynthesis
LAGHGQSWNPPAAAAARFVDWGGLRWISRHATHVLGVSETALDLHWPLWRADPARFFVWAGGVDTSLFRPLEQRPAGQERAAEMIFVGSFNPDKNQSELLDVLAAVRERVPGAVLTFIGAGARLEAVRALAQARGLGGAVTFLGLRPDVPHFLAAADVFVSTSNREGLPQAVLEAQAAGLPVVASGLEAHREALAPELREYLFPPHRTDIAADKVEALLQDPELRRKVGAAGRRFILERFDQAANMARLQGWYTDWAGGEAS